MKPIHVCDGWVILWVKTKDSCYFSASQHNGSAIQWIRFSCWFVSTTALPFSSDFHKIFKIAFLYIKDETYSFLPWLGDFRGFRVQNSKFSLFRARCHNGSDIFHPILIKIFKIALLYIKDETYSFLPWLGDFRGFRGAKTTNFRYFRLVSTTALSFLSDFDKIFKIAFCTQNMKSYSFCHGSVIFRGF